MTQMSKRYFTDENLKFMIGFAECAKSMNVTPTQLALAWLLKCLKYLTCQSYL